MKRIVLAACVLLVAAGALADAQGLRGSRLGLEFGNPGGVIIYRPGRVDFKLGYDLAGADYLYGSVDYRIISGYQLIDFLHFFLAAGGYTQFYFQDRGDGDGQIDLGGHLPVGVQAFLVGQTVEIFAEIAPVVRLFPAIELVPTVHGFIGFTVLIK